MAVDRAVEQVEQVEQVAWGEPAPTGGGPAPAEVAADVPTLPDHLVTRRRLLDLVEQGSRTSLTLVSAPAGTGKTALVAHWVRSAAADRPVVWLTTRDGGAGLVWSTLLRALRDRGVRVPRVRVPSDPRSPSAAWLARLGAAIESHPVPVVLVLDEAGQAHPALHRSLDVLVAAARTRLRVVLLTRSDPLLALNAYRLDHRLTEIRAADLVFDEAEATELFAHSGVPLTPAQVRALLDRTSGWAVGLRLAAAELQGQADVAATLARFSGEQDDVSTYLTAELLRRQPPLLREILLRTSVVDTLSPSLFETLTGLGNGRRALAFMARGNSFIETVPDRPGWFQYQSLVREFLRAQLAAEQPELAYELHRRAADWFARHGFLTAAVRHAATVGAWEDAAGYLVEDLGIGSLVADGASSETAAWFAEMPEDPSRTATSIVQAASALGAGDAPACRRDLARARALLAEDPTAGAAGAFSITLLETLDAVAAADAATGLELADAAERLLRGNHPEAVHAHPELTLLLATARARLHLWRGELAEAAAALEDAEAPASDTGRLAVVALGLRGLVAAVGGHTQEARRCVAAATELASAAGADLADWSWEVTAAQAWLLVDELDLAAAADALDQARAGAAGPDDDEAGPMTPALLALVRAHLRWVQGRRTAARSALREPDPPPPEELVRATRALRTPSRSSRPHVAPRGQAQVYAVSTAAPGEASDVAGGDLLVVELTAREREVLALLAELLSTDEIASTLCVSVNTVRTHVRSILRKLAVVRRNDAVRRAWDLGLLPTPPRATT